MLTNSIPITYKGSYGLWRMINIVILGALALGTMFTIYFVQQNVFYTIANTDAVVGLQSSVIFDIDLDSYERAVQIITDKKKPTEIPANLRNIFSYGLTAITHATTTQP